MRRNILISFIYFFSSQVMGEVLNSIYEVPVKDDRLKEFAMYEIESSELYSTQDGIVFEYALPKYLVGPNFGRIKFKGDELEKLKNDFGVANCAFDSCEIIYNSKMEKVLALGLSDTQELILADFPIDQADRLIQIAREFSGEPIGIVHFIRESQY